MATMSDKRDLLSNTQNKFNDKFRRNAAIVKNYQNMLDARLAVPKSTEIVENGKKVFRNSTHKIQQDHQTRVYRQSCNSMGRLADLEQMDSPDGGYPTMDLLTASYSKMKKPKNTIDM